MMNKKIFFVLSLLSILVFLNGCGGGGSGESLVIPPGTNTGVPSVIKLLNVQNIVQPNATLYLKALVLDGNGNPLPNVPVYFTNLSAPFGVLSATVANTDANGVATVALYSSVPGFATISVTLSSAAGQITDKTTVFFQSNPPPPPVDRSSLTLDVDSNNNGIFDEPSDFIMFDPPTKTDANIRATVTDSSGAPLLDSEVTFGSDSPDVTFPLGSDPEAPVAHTNAAGQAMVLARISPSILSTNATTVNITASAVIPPLADPVPAIITLYLKPLTVSLVTVSAVPDTVESAGTSAISATVTTSGGAPAPAGTMVSFKTSDGAITAFAKTDEFGVAKATFNAPTVDIDTNITVTASVGGKSGKAFVTVTAPEVEPPTPAALTLTASTLTVDGNAGGTITFTVSGGTSSTYSASSSSLLVFNDNGAGIGGVANDGVRESGEVGVWTGASFKATIESCTPATATVTITASDGASTVTKDIKILNGAGTTTADRPTVTPATATICDLSNSCVEGTSTATYTLTFGAGATPPLTFSASNTVIDTTTPPLPLIAAPGPFDVTAVGNVPTATTVNLLFTNDLGCKAGATVKVLP